MIIKIGLVNNDRDWFDFSNLRMAPIACYAEKVTNWDGECYRLYRDKAMTKTMLDIKQKKMTDKYFIVSCSRYAYEILPDTVDIDRETVKLRIEYLSNKRTDLYKQIDRICTEMDSLKTTLLEAGVQSITQPYT